MSIRFAILILLGSAPFLAHAQLDEGAFRQALKLKKNVYLMDGSFSGGDRASSDFTVSNVRIAANPSGFDRVVVDFSKVKRPPFFLVQNDPNEQRVLVTVYGKPKLDFSSLSANQAAKKTKSIKNLDFIPLVESDRWTWVLETQGTVKTEVFELTEPARIIIDLKP